MTFIPKLIFFVTILLIGLAFHLKNHQLVVLNYYIGEIELPISLVIVMAMCFGVFFGILASFPIVVKIKNLNNRLEKKIKNKEKEISNFRIMTTKD